MKYFGWLDIGFSWLFSVCSKYYLLPLLLLLQLFYLRVNVILWRVSLDSVVKSWRMIPKAINLSNTFQTKSCILKINNWEINKGDKVILLFCSSGRILREPFNWERYWAVLSCGAVYWCDRSTKKVWIVFYCDVSMKLHPFPHSSFAKLDCLHNPPSWTTKLCQTSHRQDRHSFGNTADF